MRAKKFLALLLSGMVLAGCLSGCNRTIIEHQFHTNTVTNTETEYIPVDTSNFSGFRCLEQLFQKYGSDVRIGVSPSGISIPSEDFDEYKSVYMSGENEGEGIYSYPGNETMEETIEDFFYGDGSSDFIFTSVDHFTPTADNTFNAASELAGFFCEQLKSYLATLNSQKLEETLLTDHSAIASFLILSSETGEFMIQGQLFWY